MVRRTALAADLPLTNLRAMESVRSPGRVDFPTGAASSGRREESGIAKGGHFAGRMGDALPRSTARRSGIDWP
jgi:hypothetical protein